MRSSAKSLKALRFLIAGDVQVSSGLHSLYSSLGMRHEGNRSTEGTANLPSPYLLQDPGPQLSRDAAVLEEGGSGGLVRGCRGPSACKKEPITAGVQSLPLSSL